MTSTPCATARDQGSVGLHRVDQRRVRPEGYFYLVRVQKAAVGSPITLQIYDPAFVATGDHCGSATGQLLGHQRQLERLRQRRRQGAVQDTPTALYCCRATTWPDDGCGRHDDHLRAPRRVGRPEPPDRRARDGCTRQYPGYTSGRSRRRPCARSSQREQQRQLQQVSGAGLPPVGDPVHLHPDPGGGLLPASAHQRGMEGTGSHQGTSYNALSDGSYQPTGSLADFGLYSQHGDNTAVHRWRQQPLLGACVRRPCCLGLGVGAGQDVDLRQHRCRVADLQPDPADAGRRRTDAGLQVLRHRRRRCQRQC